MPLTDTEFRQLVTLLQPFLRDRAQRDFILGMAFPHDEKKRNFEMGVADPKEFAYQVVKRFYSKGGYSGDLVILLQVILDEGGDQVQSLHPYLDRLQTDLPSGNTPPAGTIDPPPASKPVATPSNVEPPPLKPAREAAASKAGGNNGANRTAIIAAVIGAIAVIIAAVITIAPSLLNQSAKNTPSITETPTTAPQVAVALTQTFGAQTALAVQSSPTITPSATSSPKPTSSSTTAPSDTPLSIDDYLRQTQASWNTSTANAIASFTKTPTTTASPTRTFTSTPDIQKSIEAAFTATARKATANAIASFTKTPTATATYTPSMTLTPTLTTTPTATSIPTITANQEWMTYVIKKFEDGVDMVKVPPGCFMMGTDNPPSSTFNDEKPANKVCFSAPFYIDKTEVTQAQFDQLKGVAANKPQFAGPQRPVEQITWIEAHDFCAKRGARLPTEAEWEYAARGPDNLIYPWGNQWDASKAVWNRSGSDGTANAGSIPSGISWVGAVDMSGNVWEWTSSIYKGYPYKQDDGRESNIDTNNQYVVRGGSWYDNDATNLRASVRGWYSPLYGINRVGFRCSRS